MLSCEDVLSEWLRAGSLLPAAALAALENGDSRLRGYSLVGFDSYRGGSCVGKSGRLFRELSILPPPAGGTLHANYGSAHIPETFGLLIT